MGSTAGVEPKSVGGCDICNALSLFAVEDDNGRSEVEHFRGLGAGAGWHQVIVSDNP